MSQKADAAVAAWAAKRRSVLERFAEDNKMPLGAAPIDVFKCYRFKSNLLYADRISLEAIREAQDMVTAWADEYKRGHSLGAVSLMESAAAILAATVVEGARYLARFDEIERGKPAQGLVRADERFSAYASTVRTNILDRSSELISMFLSGIESMNTKRNSRAIERGDPIEIDLTRAERKRINRTLEQVVARKPAPITSEERLVDLIESTRKRMSEIGMTPSADFKTPAETPDWLEKLGQRALLRAEERLTEMCSRKAEAETKKKAKAKVEADTSTELGHDD